MDLSSNQALTVNFYLVKIQVVLIIGEQLVSVSTVNSYSIRAQAVLRKGEHLVSVSAVNSYTLRTHDGLRNSEEFERDTTNFAKNNEKTKHFTN